MKHGEAACGHGGDWAVRVTAQPAAGDFEPISGTEHVQKRVSLIFYVMDEAVRPLLYHRPHGVPLLLENGKKATGVQTASVVSRSCCLSSLHMHMNGSCQYR